MLNVVSSISPTGKANDVYQTGFISWRAADNGFKGWLLHGVKLNVSGALEFDRATAGTNSDPYAA